MPFHSTGLDMRLGPWRDRSIPGKGFTLLEMSMVLIVIALLAGGILVGRDLVHAAEIRSTISQQNSYNGAIQTFRLKYGGMPGNIPAARASKFGMAARTGGPGDGDGSGLIGTCNGQDPSQFFGCEDQLFWTDLGFAQLVNGSFTAADSFQTIPSSSLAHFLPSSRVGNGSYVIVYSLPDDKNYYAIKGINSINLGAYNDFNGLSPLDAFVIDSKLDDGLPLTGTVQAIVVVPAH